MSNSTPTRVIIPGASGRMGHMLIEAIQQDPSVQLHAALDLPGSQVLGQDASAFTGRLSGVKVTTDLQAAMAGAQVWIDFTRPEGTLKHVQACAEAGVNMVIGTTGFDEEGKQAIRAASQRIAIVMAPNMSVGVNVTLKLLDMAARALHQGYDIEVIEAHHRHKVDAPSGTALKMGEVIAEALGQSLSDVAVYERYGHTGERKPGSIGFSTIRGGDIVGDHTVMFAAPGERIEISHKSSSRASYAQGSLLAARFLTHRQQGIFDMFDVLGLR